MPARRLLPLALVLLLLVPVVGATDARAASLTDAQTELKILASKLKSARATNEEILAALDAVEAAFYALEGPATPEFEAVPSGALPETVRAVMSRNRALQRRHDAAQKVFDREASAFRTAATRQFMKAFQLTKLAAGKQSHNVRAPVNVRAAQVLGGVRDPRAAAALIRALDGTILKAKHVVPVELVDAAFAALGHQGFESSLKWLVDNFTYTQNSPPEQVDRLVAAHKAMLIFAYEDISAVGRFHTANRMMTIYAGVESTAQQGGASAAERSAKELWDRIRNGVIEVLQYYSDAPKNDAAEVLATVEDFRKWFRKHKNPRGAPWSDDA